MACWEGKHSLLCTLYNRHPAPPGIPDQAWTPDMTNRSSGRGSVSITLPRIYSWLFFVMWNPTNSIHVLIVSNKECHLFVGSESGGQKGFWEKILLATFPNSPATQIACSSSTSKSSGASQPGSGEQELLTGCESSSFSPLTPLSCSSARQPQAKKEKWFV